MSWRMRLAAFLCFLLVAGPADAQRSGRWEGVGFQLATQGDTDAWTIRIEFGADGNARIEYPPLQCSGTLTRVGAGAEIVWYRERITEGDCIDNGSVGILFRADKLFFFWTGEQTSAPEINATAILLPAAPIS